VEEAKHGLFDFLRERTIVIEDLATSYDQQQGNPSFNPT